MRHVVNTAFNINEYFSTFLILSFFYIITNAVGGLAAQVDFTILIFILLMHRIKDENILYYALIYGIFSDFIRGGVFGPGVILFIIFGLAKGRADLIINVKKATSRSSFYVSLILVYTVYNAFLVNFLEPVLLYKVGFHFLLNCIALAVGSFVLRLAGVTENFER